MLYNIIQSDDYKQLTSKQIKELIVFLKNNDEEFNISVNIDGVKFNPEIPQSIKSKFTQFTIFALANFTFESLKVERDSISFEAGFGEENFGSICTIPYYAIFQVSVDNSILFINPTATVEKYFTPEIDEDEQAKRSFNAFKKLK